MQQDFPKNVHECELTSKSDLALPSFLPPFVRSFSWFFKWRLWCLMSHRHPIASEWADSLAAVRRERRRQCQLSDWWIIHPFSPVRFVWEILMTLVYAVAFITVPFMISFIVLDYEVIRIDTVNPVIYVFFWLDIIFNCFTGVPSNGQKIINLRQSKKISQRISSYRYSDVSSLRSYHLQMEKNSWQELLHSGGSHKSHTVSKNISLRYFQLLRLSAFRGFSQHLQIKESTHQMVSIFVLSLYVIHWFACLCYVTPVLIMYVLRITAEECEDCWVSNVPKEEIPARYRHALFIVIQNFVASGFGGIEPRTQGHTIICTILMVLGRIFEAYVIGMFLQIRAVSKAAESKYQEIMNQLTAYTRQKQLPPYMKRRLFSYYQHRYRNSYFREKNILSGLSEQLRQEILLHSGRRLVENVAVFRSLPKDVLVSIVAHLKFELYLPNDVIVKAGTQGDCMFFLANGTVAVLTPTGKEVCHLDDGAHFGEVALLVQDQRRVASVLAIEVCEVYRLDRKDFRKCIAVQSDLYDKIERIATERMQRTAMIEEQHKRFLMNANRAARLSTRKHYN
ncbi:potassium/sodium hyperpolarization-activated cyclic nucleotide-gated channel 4-like [Venturia canescens]|uniref:potassium/sodium hyperpolarization-activated cyclic nucleotide-gated channel 4-like n=1 Tax=Venturia canescens TaxID=32260 RepID=UPI001C9BFDE4|nr:potassium/sodium hyperpolarization-activated cyclic nucleotide-gated channel 4-like [Venturia canescens]